MNIKSAFDPNNNFILQNNVKSELVIDSRMANNTNLKVTIAIPTFKRGEIICDAIDSAISQDYDKTKYEILIVDNDPSTENETEKTIRSNYFDVPNLRYFRNHKNLGLFGNWNRCFELSQGEWIVLLHDDDIIYSNFLSDTMGVISQMKNPPAILKPEMDTWNNSTTGNNPVPYQKNKFLKYSPVKAYDYIFLGNYIGSPTGCLFNRSKALTLGGFNFNLYPSADTMFILYTAMVDTVLLYRKSLGARRIGDNETFKEGVLDLFIISRYHVISYLIKRYKICLFLPKRYIQSHCKLFYEEIRNTLKPDFFFDFSKIDLLDEKAISSNPAHYISRLYNKYRQIRMLIYNLLH